MQIHRQLASHLELAPLLAPLCSFPIKTEPKRGKQKRHNAGFNAIFLYINTCSPCHGTILRGKDVQLGKGTQLAGTMDCTRHERGEEENEKQSFYYRINVTKL